jgi:peptidoglycan/xylan/chitin deacetylase (PgdA/CDA1 family)
VKKFALFTCDTEFTPPWNQGSWENQDRTTFQDGIARIEDTLAEFGVGGTFYCQGQLVEEYPEVAIRLAKRHLIGSHGYNHENYGCKPVNVWTPEQPVFVSEKAKKLELLSRCKEIHKEVLGCEPEVFVAPFDSIDYDSLDILERLGFRVDSSFDNYMLGLPTRVFRPLSFEIYELPLTVLRFGEYGYKNVLQGLTLEYGRVAEVLESEIVYITCHPYEFLDLEIPHPEQVLIVGDRKMETLKRLLQDLLDADYVFVNPLQLLDQSKTQ